MSFVCGLLGHKMYETVPWDVSSSTVCIRCGYKKPAVNWASGATMPECKPTKEQQEDK